MSFHLTASIFIGIFFGVMLVATYIAFSRPSHSSGMDVGKIYLIRQK